MHRAKPPNPAALPDEQPFDPEACRMEMMLWWSQTLNQISWVQDRLGRDVGGYASAFTDRERKRLATALDRVWHEMGFITCGWTQPAARNPVPTARKV